MLECCGERICQYGDFDFLDFEITPSPLRGTPPMK
jgi:hypothetical protein